MRTGTGSRPYKQALIRKGDSLKDRHPFFVGFPAARAVVSMRALNCRQSIEEAETAEERPSVPCHPPCTQLALCRLLLMRAVKNPLGEA